MLLNSSLVRFNVQWDKQRGSWAIRFTLLYPDERHGRLIQCFSSCWTSDAPCCMWQDFPHGNAFFSSFFLLKLHPWTTKLPVYYKSLHIANVSRYECIKLEPCLGLGYATGWLTASNLGFFLLFWILQFDLRIYNNWVFLLTSQHMMEFHECSCFSNELHSFLWNLML